MRHASRIWISLSGSVFLFLAFLAVESAKGSFSRYGIEGIIVSTPSFSGTLDVGLISPGGKQSPLSKTRLSPLEWRRWPEIPTVTRHAREIYELGQSLGNDPQALSFFGDCQSLPEVFLGLYTTDQASFASLPVNLQQTVQYFKGSLNRSSPTSKDGTTSGALLWEEWHKNEFGCTPREIPMDCELRLHNPSFVLIMVGTHWEGNRNEYYLRIILDALLERGVLPILSTKADNREGDNSINLQAATLAAEYDLPLWNFWPVVEDLPNRGLYTRDADRHLGDIYLTGLALDLRRFSALRLLDAVWRGVIH